MSWRENWQNGGRELLFYGILEILGALGIPILWIGIAEGIIAMIVVGSIMTGFFVIWTAWFIFQIVKFSKKDKEEIEIIREQQRKTQKKMPWLP
ncbi:MAG: hypothetical protein FWE45_01850 [Firmicutes bacterium]|nr:hypothetical protein [Bacillota bacterium]